MYLYLWYRGKPASTVTALLLDGEDRVIENAVLSQGRYIRPESYGDLILSFAGQRGASGVILAHNHANNVREPSVEDIFLTEQIRKMLQDTPYAGAVSQQCVKEKAHSRRQGYPSTANAVPFPRKGKGRLK